MIDDDSTPLGWFHYWQTLVYTIAGSASVVIGYIVSLAFQVRQSATEVEKLEKRIEKLEASVERTEVNIAALRARDEARTSMIYRTDIH